MEESHKQLREGQLAATWQAGIGKVKVNVAQNISDEGEVQQPGEDIFITAVSKPQKLPAIEEGPGLGTFQALLRRRR